MANNRSKAYISNDPRGAFWLQTNDPLRRAIIAFYGGTAVSKIPPELAYAPLGATTLEEIFKLQDLTIVKYTQTAMPLTSSQLYKIEETIVIEAPYTTEKSLDIRIVTSKWRPGTFNDWIVELFPNFDSAKGIGGDAGGAGTDYGSIGHTRMFRDETFFTSVPLENPSAELTDLGSLELLKTDFVYNFLQPNYENFVTNTLTSPGATTSEKSIPNLYGYFLAQSLDIYESDPLPYVSKAAIDYMSTDNSAEDYNNQIGADSSGIEEKYTNVVFTVDSPEILNDAQSLLTPFPMYIKMQWPSYKSSEFMGALRASQLDDDLMAALIDPLGTFPDMNSSNTSLAEPTFYYPEHGHSYTVDKDGNGQTEAIVETSGVTPEHTHTITNWGVETLYNEGPGNFEEHTHILPAIYQAEKFQVVETTYPSDPDMPDEPSNNNHEVNISSIDIMGWWDDIRVSAPDKIGSSFFTDPAASLSEHSIAMTDKGTQASQGTLIDLLKTLIFWGKLKTIVSDNLLSWSDLVKGKTCHSETVFYRITKTADENSSNIIQTIWIPDYPEINMTEYIDTQVSYDKNYYYHIDAFKLVVGSQYTYEHLAPQAQEWDDWLNYTYLSHAPFTVEGGKMGVRLKITTVPCIKLLECEYGKFDGSIIDSPPVSPNINIIPYKGVNNKLMFNLNTGTGEYQLSPIILSDSEQELINKIRSTKKLPSDSLITYKTDDRVKSFEIFRMDTPPKSYDDFKDKLRGAASTTLNGITDASSTSAIDMVTSNKVYYYMFRSRDFHGYVSNPSPVYKVELVEEDGAIYPLIEVMDGFPQPSTHQTSRQFKKLISILPRFTQTQVNYELSDLVDAATGRDADSATPYWDKIRLGIEEDNLFGKNFKIRLISKKTGRKIDFNLSFVTKNLET